MKKIKECSYCGEKFVEGEEMLKTLICNRYYCDEECFANDEGAYYVNIFEEDEGAFYAQIPEEDEDD